MAASQETFLESANYTMDTDNDSIVMPYHIWISTPISVTAPLYAIIFLLSLIGNALVVIVVSKVPGMRSRTNRLLCNLSVASLLLTTLCVPFLITESFLQSSWVFGPVLCKLYNVTGFLTVLFLCQYDLQCMSINNLIGVRLRYNAVDTKTVLFLSFTLPRYFFKDLHNF